MKQPKTNFFKKTNENSIFTFSTFQVWSPRRFLVVFFRVLGMMRSSLRFYSKLLRYSSQNLNPPSFSTDGVVRLCLLSHSLHLHSSSSLPDSNSSLDSLKLGLAKFNGVPAVSTSSSSTGAMDHTSFVSASASKAREIVDLTRHYSQCYWELSKARLRSDFLFLLF